MNSTQNTSTSFSDDLIPEYFVTITTHAEYVTRIFCTGVLVMFGIVTNVLKIVVLIKGRLLKNWTYGMMLNLAVSDLIICVTGLVFFFPCVVMDRYV